MRSGLGVAGNQSRSVGWAVSPKLVGGWASYLQPATGQRNDARTMESMDKPFALLTGDELAQMPIVSLFVLPGCDFVAELFYERVFLEDARS